MHEAALAVPLLRLVLEENTRHSAQRGEPLRVTRIRVRSGLLLGVEARTLQGIFALLAEGTPAEGAELAVETEPMTGHCPGCGATDLRIARRDFHCPVCGDEQVNWQGGNELYIAAITVQASRNTAHEA